MAHLPSSSTLLPTNDQVVNDSFDAPAADVEMEETADDVQIVDPPAATAAEEGANGADEDAEIAEDELPKRVTFLE